MAPLSPASQVGSHNLLMVTLDTLRYDVAERALAQGLTPGFASWLPKGKWERRHSPATFTYAAHQAFFAGFLPTPARPGRHPRLFAAQFPGSETTTEETFVFDAPDIVSGLRQQGYHTVCIGGVGFFNQLSPLGSTLPGLFDQSYWSESLGVTDPQSTENQARIALEVIEGIPKTQRLFLFINISALHQPNCFYVPGASEDSAETQVAALSYVDQHLHRVIGQLRALGPLMVIICSDHGTAYGEDGYHGHRLAHPVVWDVPYAEIAFDDFIAVRP